MIISRAWFVAAFVIIFVLTSCSSIGNDIKKQSGNLKVAYVLQNSFMPAYGNLLKGKFPDVDIEVIEIPFKVYSDSAELNKFINTYQPDLLIAHDLPTYNYFAEEQVLANLQPLAERDGYDLTEFHPQFLPYWKDGQTSGPLYGIAPYFGMEGILFDPALFQQFNLSTPIEGMTWDEIFNTASLFTESEGVIGLEMEEANNPFAMIKWLGTKEGLKWISNDGNKLTINTPTWIEVFGIIATAYQKGVLKQDTSPVAIDQPKIAMAVDSIGSLRHTEKEWGAISLPSISSSRGQNHVTFTDFFGISVHSKNVDLAWEIVKYTTGDEWASLKQNRYGLISTRQKYVEQVGGFDMGNQLDSVFVSDVQNKVSTDFNQKFSVLVNQAVNEIIRDEKTIAEAVSYLETEGQLLLDNQ